MDFTIRLDYTGNDIFDPRLLHSLFTNDVSFSTIYMPVPKVRNLTVWKGFLESLFKERPSVTSVSQTFRKSGREEFV